MTIVFGSPEAQKILARDKALRDSQQRLIESRARCHALVREHGSLDAAIAAIRTSLREPSKSPDDQSGPRGLPGERWTDLQTLLAMRKAQRRALRRAAKKVSNL